MNPLRNRLRSAVFMVLAFIGIDLAAAERKTNVVLMMADDQGWGETGYNGHPQVKTPVLDGMARTALRLDRFYSASTTCSPTRASVMTGRHANRSGAFDANYATRPEEITIAQILKQAGYRTGHFGKWHLGAVKMESPVNPNRMGFDEALSHDNFFEIDPPLTRNGAPPAIFPGESSEVIVDEAVKFARRVHAENKPFFIVIWFGSPHEPYIGLPKDVALYQGVPQEPMRHRFAEITAMDRAIGTFREALRQLGVADHTLLWYNSDNGIPASAVKDSFNGGWRGKKTEVYEGGVRVPAIIEWPAVIRRPRVSTVPCVTSDIFPTLLDLLQLSSPDPKRPIDGISLRPLIVDGTMQERPSPIGFWNYPAAGEKQNRPWIDPELSRGTARTFLNYHHPVAKVRDFGGDAAWTENRYKLVTGKPRQGAARTELFDLGRDPQERRDVAAAHPEIVQRMKAELETWQRSVERSLNGADYQAGTPW